MEQLGLPADTMRRRVEETLDLLGIASCGPATCATLSGGEQQRVAIGSVLTMHPRVLVLDEPTSALDPTAAEEVLATLTRLVHDLGLSGADGRAPARTGRARSPTGWRCWPVTAPCAHGAPADLLAASPVVPPIVELGRRLGWSPLPMTVREARRLARGLRRSASRRSPAPRVHVTTPVLRRRPPDRGPWQHRRSARGVRDAAARAASPR